MPRVGLSIDKSFLTSARLGHYTPNEHLTVDELFDLYCRYAPANEPRDYRLKRWRGWFGERCAWGIESWEIEAAFDELERAGLAPSTLNREINDIKAIFNWALREKRRVGPPHAWTSPASAVPKRAEELRRVRISDAEQTKLLRLARLCPNRKMHGLILMAMRSGARKGEIQRMRWDNTDLERGISEIGIDGKSGRYRTLILPPDVCQELSRYARPASDALIFCGEDPYRVFDERRQWDKLRAEAGLKHIHFHDLRHVCAQRLLKAGASTAVASQILGHVDARMVTRRYGSLEVNDLKQVVARAAGGGA